MQLTIDNRIIETRLHCHQDPDPERSNYYGGPLGEGYLDGPFADMEFLKFISPASIVLQGDGSVVELIGVVWHEVKLTWEQGEYKHGIVHIDWLKEVCLGR